MTAVRGEKENREQVKRDGWRTQRCIISPCSFNICLLATETRKAAAAHLLIRTVINHSLLLVCVSNGSMSAEGEVINKQIQSI